MIFWKMCQTTIISILRWLTCQRHRLWKCGIQSGESNERVTTGLASPLSRIPILLRGHAGAQLEETHEMLRIFESETFGHLGDRQTLVVELFLGGSKQMVLHNGTLLLFILTFWISFTLWECDKNQPGMLFCANMRFSNIEKMRFLDINSPDSRGISLWTYDHRLLGRTFKGDMVVRR